MSKYSYAGSELSEIYGVTHILINPKCDKSEQIVHNTTLKQMDSSEKIKTSAPLRSQNTISSDIRDSSSVLEHNVLNAATGLETWEDIEKALTNCQRCRLCETRHNVVFGEGDRNAELMFIGEGPGENEDKTGRPFVGAAGKLLTKMIEAMNYTRDEVFIANVVKCRPPGNREPMKDEVESCINFLLAQIHLIKPKVIVCLGYTAAKHILKTDTKSYSYRGQWKIFNGIKIMPTYHPAYLLYNPARKKDVWMDLQEVMKVLGKI